MKTIRFKLTEEQLHIMLPLQESAYGAYKLGRPGMVLMQVNFEKQEVRAAFLPHEFAQRLVDVVCDNDYQAEEEAE